MPRKIIEHFSGLLCWLQVYLYYLSYWKVVLDSCIEKKFKVAKEVWGLIEMHSYLAIFLVGEFEKSVVVDPVYCRRHFLREAKQKQRDNVFWITRPTWSVYQPMGE